MGKHNPQKRKLATKLRKLRKRKKKIQFEKDTNESSKVEVATAGGLVEEDHADY